jgi:hypothetical protein
VDRRLSGLHGRSGYFGIEKNSFFLLGIERRSSNPSPVAMTTELSRLISICQVASQNIIVLTFSKITIAGAWNEIPDIISQKSVTCSDENKVKLLAFKVGA